MSRLDTISNWASQLRRKNERVDNVVPTEGSGVNQAKEVRGEKNLPFPDRLAFVLKTLETAPAWQSMCHLTAVLGCVTFEQTGAGWRCILAHQPPEVYERVVSDQLRYALRRQVSRGDESRPQDGASILDGLARNGRWISCVESLDEAYRLAEVLIDFNAFHAFLPAECRTSTGGTTIIKDWLGVDMESSGELADDLVARAIFGNAWCDLILSVPADRRSNRWAIISLVENHRPPFIAGLLPQRLEPNSYSLPEIVVA
jgi:hypothetical protein